MDGECPVCLEDIKGPRPSLTATCQRCNNNFHIECLMDSAAYNCPMCRCRWPVSLKDPGSDFVWSCERCNKEFPTRYRCERHEANCGKSCFQRFFS